MTRRWFLIALLAVSGCAEFDDFYVDGYNSVADSGEPSCGCQSAPRLRQTPIAAPVAAPVMPTISTNAAPQSREPELLR